MKHTLVSTPLIITLLYLFLQCSSPEIVKVKNTLMPFEYVAIDDLNTMIKSGNIIKTRVNIRGIVTRKFICPPCPEGYDCEQCPPDYIVVSDGKSSITITCRPAAFTENEEYCFSLERKKYLNGFPFNITGWENKPGKECRPCIQDSGQ